jgi:hypothetical protein
MISVRQVWILPIGFLSTPAHARRSCLWLVVRRTNAHRRLSLLSYRPCRAYFVGATAVSPPVKQSSTETDTLPNCLNIDRKKIVIDNQFSVVYLRKNLVFMLYY